VNHTVGLCLSGVTTLCRLCALSGHFCFIFHLL